MKRETAAMCPVSPAFWLLLAILAGWMSRGQQQVIEHLMTCHP
jgi:hypothetical protein